LRSDKYIASRGVMVCMCRLKAIKGKEIRVFTVFMKGWWKE
jgi:hypothetical protein